MPSSRYHNTTLPVAELTLLNAALNLFLRHPIDTLSMTLIHRSAGVSKATFYQYFSGKKDLWAGLLLEEEHARLALLACLPEKPEWNDWRTFFLGLMASP
ncbi:MAG: TetR/AcrR family transcriptional regulator, partial [Natronospirillum sp.]